MEIKRSMSQKLRMDGRDYSRAGWYFVTLGADYHRHLFGEVVDAEMRPNALGQLVERCWAEIPAHYDHIALGEWQVMPNHFHGLVRIIRSGRKSLGEVMNVFKGAVTREWRKTQAARLGSRYSEREPARVWAPNYYDVICFEPEELAVRERYIRANPLRWALRDVPQGLVGRSRYCGNVELIRQPAERRFLRLSRRTSEAVMGALQHELATFGGIVLSTFFSPGERACLRTLQEGSARMVWVQPMAMPPKIPLAWTKAFVEKRALWLCAFPDDLREASRATCTQANQWAEALSQSHIPSPFSAPARPRRPAR